MVCVCAGLCHNPCLFMVKAIGGLYIFRGGECEINGLNPPVAFASLPPRFCSLSHIVVDLLLDS